MVAPLPACPLPDPYRRSPAKLRRVRTTEPAVDRPEEAELVAVAVGGVVVDWQLPALVGGPR